MRESLVKKMKVVYCANGWTNRIRYQGQYDSFSATLIKCSKRARLLIILLLLSTPVLYYCTLEGFISSDVFLITVLVAALLAAVIVWFLYPKNVTSELTPVD